MQEDTILEANSNHAPFYHWYHRMLAEKRLYIDYSVLSVGVMTLGLILMVEVLRHRIDHAAVGRPFFKAVLEGVYSELATLGIVEFFLYVLSTYYENLNQDRYYVFADVHFALFYTAILNAFQSVILAVVASRVSQRIWVQTESLELNHYVEIREEFEIVRQEMNMNSGGRGGGKDNPQEESTYQPRERGLKGLWNSLVYRIRYPALRLKYNELLLQIRYHELRVHFLQAYQLPLQLKVSDYLIRSEQQVLLKLVHVSSIAWLLLTGAINLLYYLIGLLSYKIGDSNVVSDALIWVFFLCMSVFVIIACLVYYKMKSIFREIMLEKTLWDVHDTANEERDRLAEQQLALFWGGDPKLVIAAIQFMQFGYAVTLAVIIIYWDDIEDGSMPGWVYPVVLALCYTLFVLVMAEVIPRFTLCTSLAQLVDEEQLRQALAAYKLAEAQREKEDMLWMENIDKSLLATLQKQPTQSADVPTDLPIHGIGGVHPMARRSNVSTRSSTPEASPLLTRTKADQSVLMAELVKLDTSALRTSLPEDERSMLSLRQMDRANRRNRRKSRSEGVAAMAVMGSKPFGGDGISGVGGFRRTGSQQTKDDTFLSSTHAKNSADSFLALPSLTTPQSTSPLLKPSTSSEKLKPEDTQLEKLKARRRQRHRRQKSVSDGVAAMARIHEQNFVALNVPHVVIEEHTEEHTDHDPDTELSPVNAQGKLFELPPSMDTPIVQPPKHIPEAPELEHHPSSMSLSSGNDLFDLGKAMTASNHASHKDDDGDNYSLESNASDGGRSDIDDVPEAVLSILVKDIPKNSLPYSVWRKLVEYFLSRKYVLMSNVFGTMVAFYMVGQRVEKFLHTEGVVSERPTTFEFNNKSTFWVLMFLFIAFLCVDTLIMFLFRHWNGRPWVFKERKVFVAAGLDFVLVSVCLGCFIAAEVKRCCVPDERRLAEDSYENAEEESERYYLDPPSCSCPPFGSRLYGGLGTIEPYTSLVGLRLFRHTVAKRIVEYIDKLSDPDEGTGMNMDPYSVFGDSSNHEGDAGHELAEEEMKGTAAELWEATVSKHPEIVEKHGEFSSEILKAMLGIQTSEDGSNLAAEEDITGQEEPAQAENPLPSSTLVPQSFALGKEYSGLTADAQGVILAGKLGRSVSVQHMNQCYGSNASIPEHEEALHTESGTILFAVNRDVPEILAPGQEVFLAPNARLVRSMRRCDRKLLPILDKWTVVDVVMTKYEIVYFEATDVDGPSNDATITGVREALSATKGGKGLRLRDVAVGRRIVGRLQLSEIESVTVEREIPVEGGSEVPDDGPDVEVSEVEWWKQHQGQHKEGRRAERWSKTKEDRLRIQTGKNRTLYLRFYSDLEDAESNLDRLNNEDEVEGDIFKNNAFQWAQTIGRLLGPEKLKQSLPHFGETSADELRDYLVVHRHLHLENDHKIHIHRRTASTGQLAGRLGRSLKQSENPLRRVASKKQFSFGEIDSSSRHGNHHARTGSLDSAVPMSPEKEEINSAITRSSAKKENDKSAELVSAEKQEDV